MLGDVSEESLRTDVLERLRRRIGADGIVAGPGRQYSSRLRFDECRATLVLSEDRIGIRYDSHEERSLKRLERVDPGIP